MRWRGGNGEGRVHTSSDLDTNTAYIVCKIAVDDVLTSTVVIVCQHAH